MLSACVESFLLAMSLERYILGLPSLTLNDVSWHKVYPFSMCYFSLVIPALGKVFSLLAYPYPSKNPCGLGQDVASYHAWENCAVSFSLSALDARLNVSRFQ